jgi:hypothetical protein
VLIPAPPHDVPPGPIAARWLGYELPPLLAATSGKAHVAVENAGSATWRSDGNQGVQLAYHWLDPLGNPIVWDGVRSPFERPVGPGERAELDVTLDVPMPPGDYRLAFDLVHEHRFWFAEVGSPTLELPVAVRPRIARRALAVRILGGTALAGATKAALAAQDEAIASEGEATAYLAAGCLPAPDWSRRVLDAHEEGFVAVAGSVEVEGGFAARSLRRALEPWAPGFGRAPEWTRSLLCPSLLVEAPLGEFHGLPALDPKAVAGPVLCDGRIRVRLPGGRPPA